MIKSVIFYETNDGLNIYKSEDDLTKFNGVFINITETGLEDELNEITFTEADKISEKEATAFVRQGAEICHFGFLF